MTTLFEDADNANPPSPSLDILDAPSLKNDLDNERKETASVSTSTSVEINGGTLYTVGNGGQIQQVITPTESGALTAVTVDGAPQDGSRYYYPAVANDGNQGGQFYVMMSQDVIPVAGNSGPRIIAPRAQNLTPIGDGTFAVEQTEEPMSIHLRKVETTRSSRDERRRATHNEVERRRRDKINTWIMKIAAVVPDCQMDQSKQGTSKGGVLSKALDHIIKLRNENERMRMTIKEQERILVENQVLRQQVEKLRQNQMLQANMPLRQTETIEHTDGKLQAD